MSRLLSTVFWQSTAETTIGYAAAGAAVVLSFSDPAIHKVLGAVGIGAALGFCKSLSSLQIQPSNGTDSFNPRVVAKVEAP